MTSNELEHLAKVLADCQDIMCAQNDVAISIGRWRRLDKAKEIVAEALREDREAAEYQESLEAGNDPLDDFNYVGSRHHY